jgi:uncharacterized damage-inducible protein DinB
MNAKDSIRNAILMSDRVITSYIQDLADSDLLIRAVPGMNPIAWQLGHLIASERHFVELIKPGSCPPLPEGFADAHSAASAKDDDTSRYCSLAKYQELWKAQREATLAVLDEQSETDLDREDPSYPSFAGSVGKMLHLCGLHATMHSGQFVAVRRLLGKPVAI